MLHGSGDKIKEVIEAVTDLSLVLEGCVSHIESEGTGEIIETLARHCSVFLRKTALGDSHNPKLLDNKTCEQIGLVLGRVRKPPASAEVLEAAGLAVKESTTRIVFTADETGEVTDRSYHAGPWSFSVRVDWPLPGVLDWPSRLTSDSKLPFDPCGMFSNPGMPSCEQWIGQQLLVCDGVSVSLADVVRSTVNTDGAHAPVTYPSNQFHGGREPSVKQRREDAMSILGGITVCGFRYTHLVTGFAGLYLYLVLVNSKLGEELGHKVGIPTFELSLSGFRDLECCTVSFGAHIPMAITGVGSITHKIRNVR